MAHLILFPQAARAIVALPGETILAAALREGLAYPHGCQRGRCGSCKSRLLQGKVDLLAHSPFALEAPERNEGLVLACRAVPTSDITVYWPDAVGALPPMSPIKAVVVARHEIAPQIQRLLVRPAQPLSFLPGQYVNITLPGGITRSYSPASQPMAQNVEFHIRVVDGGEASGLVSRLSLGDSLQLAGPFGDACFRGDQDRPLLALAASTGQAPIKSIVDRLLASGDQRAVQVFAFARETHHLYLDHHFAELAARHSNLGYRSIVTRAMTEDATPQTLIASCISQLHNWSVHIAGPAGFVTSMSEMVRELGCDDILADKF
ncbi:2Fe-2S iron-sulfur cluster-binding protein [Devosia sp.]|uniref:2Fe-2S iron-sulfur cluster-binding protein n=1 Tax=Devosia sp. TaxID=1871048 RepID=UPI0027372BC2|nr:2Fe-2S iron-sulfur cluster-binding protein [Devosia sp.]MDP2779631.1 FAD-binding oxidoreductase [Devosia sp.]